MLNHNIKMTIVDNITKAVQNAPPISRSTLDHLDISYRNWLRYVDSILNITAQYINPNWVLIVKQNITNIDNQNVHTPLKITNISQTLLNFAKQILNL